MSYVIMKLV